MESAGYVYCGRRTAMNQGIEVFRNGKPFGHAKSLKVRNHSPDGFNWGYCGSGPAQLALALLLDALRDRGAAQQWYQQFKAQIVSCWSDEWTMTQAEILRWYQSAQVEHVCRKVIDDGGPAKTDRDCPTKQAAPAQGTDARDGVPVLGTAADQRRE